MGLKVKIWSCKKNLQSPISSHSDFQIFVKSYNHPTASRYWEILLDHFIDSSPYKYPPPTNYTSINHPAGGDSEYIIIRTIPRPKSPRDSESIIVRTIPRPKSPPAVLTILRCHSLLDEYYDSVEGGIVEFKAKESVTSVAKLLVRFHDNFAEYRLGVTTYFYPCVGTTMLDTRHTCTY